MSTPTTPVTVEGGRRLLIETRNGPEGAFFVPISSGKPFSSPLPKPRMMARYKGSKTVYDLTDTTGTKREWP